MVIRGCFRKILIKIISNSIRNKRRPTIYSFIMKAMENIMQVVEHNVRKMPLQNYL